MQVKGITEIILYHLRDQIITGVLEENTRLNEVEIAKTLGVSRSPLREAMRLLENGNFIYRIPRRGTFVTDLTSKNLEKVYEARIAIESFAIDILKKNNITVFENAEIALQAASKLKFPVLEDTSGMLNYVMVFADFHVGLIEATENDYLVKFYRSIAWDMARYQFICLYLGLTENSYSHHENILASLKEGRYKSAKKELLEHIIGTMGVIKSEVSKREEAKKQNQV